jgi:hypothetical protein
MESDTEDIAAIDELGTGAKGKRGELIVMGELLRRSGLQVYLPVVDSGVDCVVDIGGGNYREVQIKYRENSPIFAARNFRPRDSFFFVCWLSDRGGDDFWVIPSRVFHELGKPTVARGKERIQLNIGKEGSENYSKLAPFHHTFEKLLQGATTDVQRAVRKASRKVEGEHFVQREYEREILTILTEAELPMSSKQLIDKIKERMGSSFSKADLGTTSRGRTRWESTARFAIYQGLKKRKLIEAKSKNQWVITTQGRAFLKAG